MSILPFPFLVSDIDGTLVNSEKEISKENEKSLSLFREMGGLFTLATGRSYVEAKRYIEQLDVSCPVILCNGAMLFDPATQNLTPVCTMDREILLYILKRLTQSMPSTIDFFVYGIDRIYATKLGPLSRMGLEGIDFRLEMVNSFDQLPKEPFIKLIAIAAREEMDLLTDWCRQLDHLPLEFILSSDHYFEILPQGVSKGNAVKGVLDRFNLTPQQAAAIGDHCNDLSMLKLVGLPGAVANAHPLVLQQARVIVPPNDEHGVSHFIHQYLIPSLHEKSAVK